MSDKKVRATSRPEAKTLRERPTMPTTPDGEAARVVEKRKEGVPTRPLDIDETAKRRGS